MDTAAVNSNEVRPVRVTSAIIAALNSYNFQINLNVESDHNTSVFIYLQQQLNIFGSVNFDSNHDCATCFRLTSRSWQLMQLCSLDIEAWSTWQNQNRFRVYFGEICWFIREKRFPKSAKSLLLLFSLSEISLAVSIATVINFHEIMNAVPSGVLSHA